MLSPDILSSNLQGDRHSHLSHYESDKICFSYVSITLYSILLRNVGVICNFYALHIYVFDCTKD